MFIKFNTNGNVQNVFKPQSLDYNKNLYVIDFLVIFR